MKMEENKTYTTSDLYLTAFLKLKGYKFLVEKNKNKAVFVFDRTDELIVLVGQYLTQDATCCPLSYSNAIKNLKNLIYNL